jgi:hypothetical protein
MIPAIEGHLYVYIILLFTKSYEGEDKTITIAEPDSTAYPTPLVRQ